MADPPHLYAGAVIFEGFLQPPFHRAVVAVLFHVNEVDHNQARKVAQAQLPGNFIAGFKVGLERRVFDIVLARGLAGVDVDGNQRFRLVHDDVTAGRQRNRGRIKRIQLRFSLML